MPLPLGSDVFIGLVIFFFFSDKELSGKNGIRFFLESRAGFCPNPRPKQTNKRLAGMGV